MTYLELIDRAAFAAFPLLKGGNLDKVRTDAEALFPSIVEALAQTVAADSQHPWRSVLQDVTASISSGDLIPQTGAGGKEIIGAYGTVKDAVDGKELTLTPDSDISRYITDQTEIFHREYYMYAIKKPRIYHTRDNVTIDVCVFDEADVAAAIAANQIPIFPDAEGYYVTALVDALVKAK